MASTGPNTAHPHSSFICPSFTPSLHLLASFLASLTPLSVCVHTQLCPCFLSPSLALPLFFLSSRPLLFYWRSWSLALPLSLAFLHPSIPPPGRRGATSVEAIRYSRHTWTALTGINHEYFEVPMQGSSDCL